MKVTVIVLFTCVYALFATEASSQNTKVSIYADNLSVREVIREIEEQTDYLFVYNKNEVNVNRSILLNVVDEPIFDVLNKIFAETEVEYKLVGKNITLIKRSLLSEKNKIDQQTPKKVTGAITDQKGEPIIGANVVEKGTTNGTITDMDGKFSLQVEDKAILLVSYIGYLEQNINTAGKTTVNVLLQENTQALEEVVVVGYGVQKKANLTGAVSTVSQDVFENKSMSTPLAALQGVIPGVGVTRGSGKPGGENYNVQIRGASSINNVGVLVMVDGVRGSLNELNPNDIESISVLKDAAAAAIYGSNAAGGVMLITTKKGKNDKVEISYSGSFGVTQASRMPTRMKSWDEAKYYDESLLNSAGTIYWGETKYAWMRGEKLDVIDEIGIRSGVRPSDFFPGERFVIDPTRPNVWLSYSDVDQIKVALKKTNTTQTHNLSAKGGNEKNSYYMSAGYYNRRGILRYGPDSEERYNLRLNLQNKFTDKISLNSVLAFTNNNIYQPARGVDEIILLAYKFWGWEEPYRPNGEYHASNGIWPSIIQIEKEEGKDTRKNYQFEGSVNLKIEDVFPGLEINLIGAKRMGINQGDRHVKTLTYTGAAGIPIVFNPTNSMHKFSNFSHYTSFQAFATYNLKFLEKHNFTVLGGYSFEDFRHDNLSAGISNLVTNELFSLNWGDPQTATVSDGVTSASTMGYFARLNYSFNDKYLFESNLRYDGSSRLAPQSRWQLFPSLSAGWIVSNESFFPENNIISNLKLRASWGQLGNSDALGYYDYIGMLNAGSNIPFNNARNTRVYQSQLASPEKTWETIETTNIGIDTWFLNNRLSLTGEYYIKRNKDMLANMEVQSIIGVGLPTFNIGELKTNGWEINLTWKDMSKPFKYWVSAQLSDNTNKLVKYSGKNVVTLGQVALLEGMPLNTIWGYKTDGLFQSDQEYKDYGVFINPRTGQGDMKYVDLDGDEKISMGEGTLKDHGDMVKLGDTNPRYMFGLDLGFEWNGFSFSCFFQGVAKRKILLNTVDLQPMFSEVRMPYAEQLDYWTTENRNAFWPRPYLGSTHSYWASDYWIQDAAYIRLKNIELGYTLPQSLTERVSLRKVRVFMSGQDVFELTNVFSFIDPELPNNAGVTYPFSRVFQAGLNITF
ncbi:TonB-dependent receptor [Massilibacteroides vaginae]|uniref:TonB-dependent receptor n=1 Tax=Massilibacteroides vaginae TaxID=1673718 RepID=UPI001592DF41|nr:TonB-dependent receptor [Massilibacteroides vaginae]